MKRLPVTSNAIRSIGHDKKRGQLEVEFHNGRRYRFDRVPEHVYFNLINADSVGSFFNSKVRHSFGFTELGPDRDSVAKDEESLD